MVKFKAIGVSEGSGEGKGSRDSRKKIFRSLRRPLPMRKPNASAFLTQWKKPKQQIEVLRDDAEKRISVRLRRKF